MSDCLFHNIFRMPCISYKTQANSFWSATENAFIAQDNDLMALQIAQRKVMLIICSLRLCTLEYGVPDLCVNIIIYGLWSRWRFYIRESSFRRKLHGWNCCTNWKLISVQLEWVFECWVTTEPATKVLSDFKLRWWQYSHIATDVVGA